jgi:DNA-binding response OmpR family regulator
MAKILVIDDDVIIRSFLHEFLREEGHEVFEAGDGNQGIVIYRAERPDLIITNMIMPVKKGLEMILELRRCYRNLKIIAISGGDRRRTGCYLQAAEIFGAQRTMAKPFAFTALLEMVGEVLRETC